MRAATTAKVTSFPGRLPKGRQPSPFIVARAARSAGRRRPILTGKGRGNALLANYGVLAGLPAISAFTSPIAAALARIAGAERAFRVST